jgi:uncharacterized membrane protein
MAVHPIWVLRWLSDDDLAAVTAAIAAAERATSAEVRVHLDLRCPVDPMARAVAVFEQLRMHNTRDRNAVLVYVALEDHRLAVVGDQGIHERVGQLYWERLVAALRTHFVQGRPRQGLIAVLDDLGRQLAQHFPRRPDDVNELTDELSVQP